MFSKHKMECIKQEIIKETSKTVTIKPKFYLNKVAIPVPSRGQVLVKVKACGLSIISQAILSEVLQKETDSYPCGQDVSGVVVKVGEGVTNVDLEDDVVGVLPLDSQYSGCGEFCLFNEYDLVKKPRMLNFEDAAAGIGDCVRAYTALHYQAQVCAGDTVLVLDGASSFGSVAVQLARQWGAKVIASVTSHAEKLYLESLNPPVGQIIELNQRSNILVSSVMEETGGLGVDVVIDNGVKLYTNEEDCNLPSERRKYPTPHKHEVISCLGIGGKWVTSQFDLQLDPPDCQQLFLRGGSVNFLFDQAWTLSYAQQGRYQHILHDVIDKLDRGYIKCKVSETVPLDKVPEKLSEIEDIRVGKMVMVNSK